MTFPGPRTFRIGGSKDAGADGIFVYDDDNTVYIYNSTVIANGGLLLYWDNVVATPLLPGQMIQVSFAANVTAQITGTYRNFVTATGTYPGGTITDTDNVLLEVVDPSVVINKAIVAHDRDAGNLQPVPGPAPGARVREDPARICPR